MKHAASITVVILMSAGLALADSMSVERNDDLNSQPIGHSYIVPTSTREFSAMSRLAPPIEDLATHFASNPVKLAIEADPSMSAMVRTFDHESDGGIGMVYVYDEVHNFHGPKETAVPEPMSILLIGTGLTGIAALKRRRLLAGGIPLTI